MPKTDDTRYASEIPAVLAWDPTLTNSEIEKAKSIASDTRKKEYEENYKKALRHKEVIKADMKPRGFAKVNKISWQANFNRNNNGSPADVCFENHPVGGISVKDGSDIIGNFGTTEFEEGLNRPRGEDLFRFLAAKQFDNLLIRVKTDLINQLAVGEMWTEDRENGRGKYSIERTDSDKFVLRYGSRRVMLSRNQLLTETFTNRTGAEKKLSGQWRRVFGDFYQTRKKTYKAERDALFAVLYPIIRERCERIIIADPEKLCQIGGFTEKSYYVSDLRNDKIYFVPDKTQVLNRIKVEIFNKDKDHSFGSGFELGCKIKLVDSDEYATLDFYVCYNSGTFNRGPVIKIQGFRDKEKLWQRIY